MGDERSGFVAGVAAVFAGSIEVFVVLGWLIAGVLRVLARGVEVFVVLGRAAAHVGVAEGCVVGHGQRSTRSRPAQPSFSAIFRRDLAARPSAVEVLEVTARGGAALALVFRTLGAAA